MRHLLLLIAAVFVHGAIWAHSPKASATEYDQQQWEDVLEAPDDDEDFVDELLEESLEPMCKQTGSMCMPGAYECCAVGPCPSSGICP